MNKGEIIAEQLKEAIVEQLKKAIEEDNQSPRPFSVLEWIKEHLKTTSDLRDGLLIAASILYIVGYLVWSFSAWQNHLGLLPALDPQYFVAGLVPVIIMLVAYLGGRYVKRFFVYKWPVLVGKEAKGLWLVIRIALLFMFWAILALYIVVSLFISDSFSRTMLSVHAESIDRVLAIAFGISFTFLPPMEVPFFNHLSRVYRWVWVNLSVLLFVVLGLTFYMSRMYPKLPQEFGGVRPRCASLDIVKSQVSNETLQGIASTDAIMSSQPVVRSLKVDVLYSGGNVILVRSKGRVYEIAKSVIQATNECD